LLVFFYMYGYNFTSCFSNIQLCLYMTNKTKKPRHEGPTQVSFGSLLFTCISPLFSRKKDSFVQQAREREIKMRAICRSLSYGLFSHAWIPMIVFSLYVSLFLSGSLDGPDHRHAHIYIHRILGLRMPSSQTWTCTHLNSH